ncbi:MAG: efflux RND transporter periplasmic adaptor subunit [Steroidobacteraceae bacterium]
MNQKIIAAALAAVLVVGVAIGYWIATQRAVPNSGAAADGMAATEGDRKVLYWYDPMRPEVKFDKPGKSPFMDMQLVPKYAEKEGATAVRIDPAVAQNLGIRLGKVEKAVLEPRLAAVGSVAFDERRLHVVQARVEGYITRLYVKTSLEWVRLGQPLAEIQAPEWLAAQDEYLALLDAESERARSIRDVARERLVVLGVPEATIRRIEETRNTDATTTVFAPADGVVTELAVREGAAFMPGAPLFRINGLETVWVNAQVPEAQVGLVQPGSTVVANATAWPGVTFKGRVSELLPDIDPGTRTLPVRIVIENPDGKLAPGMFVSLDFEAKAGDPQLLVPSEAVIVTGERSVVIVAREGGGFDVAEVTLGAEADGKTAILSGLEVGQLIVLSGQFLIDSEASLKSAVTRLETQGESHGTHP